MGLFGSKKTYVASTVYNMAGDPAERINYLKTVVNASVIGNSRFSIAECLNNNYMTGPGIHARSFHRWCKRGTNYDKIGVPTARIRDDGSWDVATIKSQLPLASGETATINDIRYELADFSYWAEQWVMANYQSRFKDAWVSDYNPDTGLITITWPDLTTSSFAPVGMVGNTFYYYVTYGVKNGTTFLGSRMWIYQVGTGNAVMDAMEIVSPTAGEFLPFIPIRFKNEFISETYKPNLYAQTKKAYKKATRGKSIDDLVDLIADNDDLDDIDHAYMVYGVSLNTADNKCRRYLFKFFENMMSMQAYTSTDYSDYEAYKSSYTTSTSLYMEKRRTYLESADPVPADDPVLSQNPEVSRSKPLNSIEIKSHGTFDARLHMVVRWSLIKKTSGTGLKKPDAKVGDLWWDPVAHLDGDSFVVNLINAVLEGAGGENTRIILNWQKSADYWESLEITGLVHKNKIYDGKSVDISAYDALTDEDESGFILPIHYDTMKDMSLVDSTQMMTQSAYIVFNSYKVVKKKWYQTGIFKIFVFVVMIAITVATGGAGAIGLLGTAGAVGGALGFVGVMATIVGAIANAIAAMILMQLLSVVSTAVFGAKIGAIIATIASVAAMSFGTSMLNGMSMAQAWGNMMSVVNILNMTSAVGDGISGYINASVAGIQGKTQDLMEEYQKASAKIQKMWIEEFGQGDFHFDPNQLTNNYMGGITELPDGFLSRTLMTGSDIADMTNGMLSDFANLTLDVNAIAS